MAGTMRLLSTLKEQQVSLPFMPVMLASALNLFLAGVCTAWHPGLSLLTMTGRFDPSLGLQNTETLLHAGRECSLERRKWK